MDSDVASGALGNLFSAGMGFATGNPIAAASGIAGLGLSIFGGSQKADAAKQVAAAQMETARLEQKQELVRKQAMELSARRQQMEVLRNAQRARSLALQAATTQGAQGGSGLQGGYGQISGASNWNVAGINQNLGFGEQMFDLNSQISGQKMKIAAAGGQAATAAGMQSLGGSLITAMGPLKNLGTMSKSSGNIPGVSGDTSYGGWASSTAGGLY